MKDIYFEKEYARINEKIEDGFADFFEYDAHEGNITYSFIKRKINQEINGATYFDIVSPYGYGGPIINQVSNYEKLIENFRIDFKEFCFENNIVSEFVRFHPVQKNHIDFNNLYDIELSRMTVGTNLLEFDDPFQEEFSKSCRKKIRRLLKKGLTYKIIEKPSDLSRFTKFYYSTMDRNNAENFYYFNQSYFDEFLNNYQENIILAEVNYEEETIAMGFYFVYDGYIHIHLSGTLSEHLNKSPAYILRYGITRWGKENGYKMIHHGGGRSSNPEDGLYKFKKQFGNNTSFGFHIGKKIWNQKIYSELCKFNNVSKDTEFFPAYRKGK